MSRITGNITEIKRSLDAIADTTTALMEEHSRNAFHMKQALTEFVRFRDVTLRGETLTMMLGAIEERADAVEAEGHVQEAEALRAMTQRLTLGFASMFTRTNSTILQLIQLGVLPADFAERAVTPKEAQS